MGGQDVEHWPQCTPRLDGIQEVDPDCAVVDSDAMLANRRAGEPILRLEKIKKKEKSKNITNAATKTKPTHTTRLKLRAQAFFVGSRFH